MATDNLETLPRNVTLHHSHIIDKWQKEKTKKADKKKQSEEEKKDMESIYRVSSETLAQSTAAVNDLTTKLSEKAQEKVTGKEKDDLDMPKIVKAVYQ